MAPPVISFKHNAPIQFTCGAFKELIVSVKPGATGKGMVKLMLKSASCSFHNGSKTITSEFTAAAAAEELDCVIKLAITCTSPGDFSIILTAEVSNSEGKTDTRAIDLDIDCQKTENAKPSSSKKVVL